MLHKYKAVVLDGPAGVGKSTVAKALARKLEYEYIDTGAMYRAVTLFALENDIPIELANQQRLLELVQTDSFNFIFDQELLRVFYGDREITSEIRSHAVTQNVSHVAALPTIRVGLRNIQRQMADNANVVMEGRDIGTAVLPQAQYKFFLTASVSTRAKRRHQELKGKGKEVQLGAIQAEIQVRDQLDSSREHSPLRKAEDAIEIDTTDLNIAQVLALILSYVK